MKKRTTRGGKQHKHLIININNAKKSEYSSSTLSKSELILLKMYENVGLGKNTPSLPSEMKHLSEKVQEALDPDKKPPARESNDSVPSPVASAEKTKSKSSGGIAG